MKKLVLIFIAIFATGHALAIPLFREVRQGIKVNTI